MDVRILIYILYLTFATFGIIFNGFILLVFFWQRRIHTSTHILLFHLAILDTLFCFAIIIFTSVTLSFGSNNVSVFNISLHTLLQMQQFTWTILSGTLIWTLTGLSCDRYTSICYPFTYSQLVTRKRTLSLIVLSWISSFTFSILPFLFKSIDASSSCVQSIHTIYPSVNTATQSDSCFPFSLDPTFLILTLPLSFHSSSFTPFNISLQQSNLQQNVSSSAFTFTPNLTDRLDAQHFSSLSHLGKSGLLAFLLLFFVFVFVFSSFYPSLLSLQMQLVKFIICTSLKDHSCGTPAMYLF